MPPMKNLYEHPQTAPGGEFAENLYKNKNARVERIISYGHASPKGFWYDQEEDEWVCVLRGEAAIMFEDGEKRLAEGSHIVIPAHARHRVEYASEDCVWLAVFSAPD